MASNKGYRKKNEQTEIFILLNKLFFVSSNKKLKEKQSDVIQTKKKMTI